MLVIRYPQARVRRQMRGILPPARRAGAADRNRTRNLLFTKQLLCQLSYGGAP
jgi:hypothetical protein